MSRNHIDTEKSGALPGNHNDRVSKLARLRVTDLAVAIIVALSFIASYVVGVIIFTLAIASVLTLFNANAASGVLTVVFASLPSVFLPWVGAYFVIKYLAKATHRDYAGETYKYFAILSFFVILLSALFISRIISPSAISADYVVTLPLLAACYIAARIMVINKHKSSAATS